MSARLRGPARSLLSTEARNAPLAAPRLSSRHLSSSSQDQQLSGVAGPASPRHLTRRLRDALAIRCLPSLSALALALAFTAGCVAPETRPGTPDHPAFQRAEQAMLLGDEDQALTLYRSYRQGFGNSDLVSECFLREGTILLKKGRIAEAERSFHEAIARPRSTFVAASAWVGVGDCRFSVDDYDGAATAYQRSLDLGARDARNDYALYRLGVSRQRSGDWEAGKSCYQLVLRDHEKSALKVRAEQRLRYPDRSLHLQVGAFQNEAGAKELETRLHAQGLIAKTVNVANGPAPYLVWVGDYDSVAIANRQLPAVKAVVGEGVILVP